MTARTIRTWYLVHKWTSIVCTAFLLLLCLTGLPLIFHHEIDHATRAPRIEAKPAGQASLDAVLRDARAQHPGHVPLYLTYDAEEPLIYATVGTRPAADEDEMRFMLYDARDAARIDTPPLDGGVMRFLFDLHANLLLGLPGELFLGGIGVIFLVAIVSGVVVYAPFMRKLPFAAVRRDRSTRVKWLDTHNMVGIVTIAWASMVGLTGFVITMSLPMTSLWQSSERAALAATYGRAAPATRLSSIDAAVAVARHAVPEGRVSFIAFPGTAYSTPHHFMIAMAGRTPLTARLIDPVLVDATTGRLTAVRTMPWYMQALFLSVPLHFGDYGGLPLKIIWALLDIAAIVVLGTGLYLWLGRRRAPLDRRVAELTSGGAADPL